MAKKKAVETESSMNELDFLAELGMELEKEKTIEFSPYDTVQIKKNTGFDIIDAILASNEDERGFELRTFNTFYGNSGSGKSTLLFQMAYNFIKNTKDGQIIYVDAEKTMTKDRMQKLGIDEKRVMLIKSGTTVENYYRLVNRAAEVRSKQKEQFGEDYIMENPIIVIVDSLTALSSEREIDAGTDINSAMGTVAKLHSVLLKGQIDLLFRYNITVLGILQVRDELQIGPTPKAKQLLYLKQGESLSGGKAIPFYSFYLGKLTSKKKLDDSYGVAGVEVEFNMVKSKSSPANKPVTLIFFPLTGYSNLWSNYKFLVDSKIIGVAGAYKKLPGYEKNFFTKDLENLYNTNEEFRLAFDKCVKENLTSYIESIPPIEETDISLEMLAEDGDVDETVSGSEEA